MLPLVRMIRDLLSQDHVLVITPTTGRINNRSQTSKSPDIKIHELRKHCHIKAPYPTSTFFTTVNLWKPFQSKTLITVVLFLLNRGLYDLNKAKHKHSYTDIPHSNERCKNGRKTFKIPISFICIGVG
jgi:hypothetical protein